MPKTITYGQLHQFLLDLGFEDKSVNDSHAGFRHAVSATVILLAIHQPRDPAKLADVRYVRRILIERGLVTSAEFDGFLAEGRIPESSAKRSTAS